MGRLRAILVGVMAMAGIVLVVFPVNAWEWVNGSYSEKGGFKRYVPPVTMPYFNETPYITTEIKPAYLFQRIPSQFVTRGGYLNAGAVQVRVALTERLGIIATKTGFTGIEFNHVLGDESGFLNIAAGAKYALIAMPEHDFILTLGARFEPPTGDIKTSGLRLQGHGDGMLDVFLSSAKSWGKLGVETCVGTNIAMDTHENTTQVHYSAHIDYELFPGFFPLFEINGISKMDEGSRLSLDLEGHDLLNLGSQQSGTTITVAGGIRYVINPHVIIGAAWESTITGREDLMDHRVTADITLRY